jgi:hypothetical protein
MPNHEKRKVMLVEKSGNDLLQKMGLWVNQTHLTLMQTILAVRRLRHLGIRGPQEARRIGVENVD